MTAVAERLRNQAEQTAGMSRVYNRRGRVLQGFGGTLGGYTMSLQKNNADKEDQIMQNKYANGEIGVDEMIQYLTNTANRAWLSTEDKKLLMQTIGQMKDKKTDASYADQYSSGTITAKQYLAYKQQRLASLNPGSPLYDSISTDVDQLKKAAAKEDLNNYFKKEAARVSNLSDASSQYIGYENLYQDMANKANAAGLTNEANDYLTKAGEYKIEAAKATETLKTANLKKDKAKLVDKINLAINSYVNNKITPQQFSGLLDQYQSSAITNGHTDLLKDLNSWSNNVREDIQYGKAFDRGGTRIKGPGVGGGATYDIYGNLIEGGGSSGGSSGGSTGADYTGGGTSGGGVNSNIKTGNASIKTNTGSGITPQSTYNLPGGDPNTTIKLDPPGSKPPEVEDKIYEDSKNQLLSDFQNGEIDKNTYLTDYAKLLADRKDILDYRISTLSKNPKGHSTYENTKQKNSTLIDQFNKELNDPKTGINNLWESINSDQDKQGVAVIMEQALVNGFVPAGSKPTPLIVQNDPKLDQNYITDANGIKREISVTTDKLGITPEKYSSLSTDEQLNYQYSNGVFKHINQKYVDITDKSGNKFRYLLNNDNSIAGATNLKTGDNYNNTIADKFYTPTQLGNRINEQIKQSDIKKAEMVKATPISQGGILPDVTPNINKKPILPFNNIDLSGTIITPGLGDKLKTPLVTPQVPTPTPPPLSITPPVKPVNITKSVDTTNMGPSDLPKPNIPTPNKIISSIVDYRPGGLSMTPPKPVQPPLQVAQPPKPTINLTPTISPSNLKAMAPPPAPEKKPSLWDKITGLFKR